MSLQAKTERVKKPSVENFSSYVTEEERDHPWWGVWSQEGSIKHNMLTAHLCANCVCNYRPLYLQVLCLVVDRGGTEGWGGEKMPAKPSIIFFLNFEKLTSTKM